MRLPTTVTPASPDTGLRRLPHVPGLDGVRAIAVILVILAHAQAIAPIGETGFAPVDGIVRGGFLGVDIFFVLSGFLITALLLNELGTNRRVGYGAFYARRALRLLPALYLLIVVEVAYALGSGFDLGDHLTSVVAALVYLTNYQSVLAPETLVHNFGHLWSLAVEEQFYLLWPLALVGFFGLRRSSAEVATKLLIVIFGVAVWRSMLLAGGAFWPELTVRTDTRVDALLIGALAASLWVRRSTPERHLDVAAWVALAGVVVGIVVFDVDDDTLSQWGATAFAFGVAVIVLALVEGSWSGRRIFEWRPLRAVGRVSYGVYLWHYPVIISISERPLGLGTTGRVLLAAALTVVAVIASWRLVEQPALLVKRRWSRSAAPDVEAPSLRTYLGRWGVVALAAASIGWGLGSLAPDPVAGDGGFPAGDIDRSGYWSITGLEPVFVAPFADDGEHLGDAEIGGAWNELTGAWSVADGTAVAEVDTTALAVPADDLASGAVGGLTEVTLSRIAPGAGLAFRVADGTAYWSVTVAVDGDGWSIHRVADGSPELVTTLPDVPTDGTTVSIVEFGPDLRVLLDGEESFVRSDAYLAGVIHGGPIANGVAAASARWDRFLLMRNVPTDPGVGGVGG